MSAISHYPAIQQINFYVNEASPELIAERRNYLEGFILPTWKARLEQMLSWNEKTDSDLALIATYQKGVDFLTEALTQRTVSSINAETQIPTLNYDPTDPDKMRLPVGVTCGNCRHIHRCKAIFGHTETDTYCDWSPSRFVKGVSA